MSNRLKTKVTVTHQLVTTCDACGDHINTITVTEDYEPDQDVVLCLSCFAELRGPR